MKRLFTSLIVFMAYTAYVDASYGYSAQRPPVAYGPAAAPPLQQPAAMPMPMPGPVSSPVAAQYSYTASNNPAYAPTNNPSYTPSYTASSNATASVRPPADNAMEMAENFVELLEFMFFLRQIDLIRAADLQQPTPTVSV